VISLWEIFTDKEKFSFGIRKCGDRLNGIIDNKKRWTGDFFL